MIHVTSFTVYPEDCNYMTVDSKPMVHGGTMLLKSDRAAAEAVKKLLIKSHVKNALTVSSQMDFHEGAKLGDLIEIRCSLEDLGIKSLTIGVECHRMNPNGTYDKMATGSFRFCSMFLNTLNNRLQSAPHGLRKEDFIG